MCKNIDKDSFLRAMQLHVFYYGIPLALISDNGSQIVAGVKQTISYLDIVTKEFLSARNIKLLSFHPYPNGASQLGGFVESMMKQMKKIIHSAVGHSCT